MVWADRRCRLGHGRAFMLYVALYTAGRFWIELLRIDDANHILGLRVNTWVSSLVFVGAVVAFVISARRRPGRETPAELLRDPSQYVEPDAPEPDQDDPDVPEPDQDVDEASGAEAETPT